MIGTLTGKLKREWKMRNELMYRNIEMSFSDSIFLYTAIRIKLK